MRRSAEPAEPYKNTYTCTRARTRTHAGLDRLEIGSAGSAGSADGQSPEHAGCGPALSPAPRRSDFYHDIVVSAAEGLEAFGWRVAWFVLILMFIWSLGRTH